MYSSGCPVPRPRAAIDSRALRYFAVWEGTADVTQNTEDRVRMSQPFRNICSALPGLGLML